MKEEDDTSREQSTRSAMSFLDLVSQPSVYDLLSSVEVSPAEAEALQKAASSGGSIKPFIKFVDMNNNSGEKQNKPKTSVVIGIDISF